MNSQTAAIAGKLLLARAGRIADVQDWARNLMTWFPDIPDGAVLWAESLRSAVERGVQKPFGVEQPVDEMARALGLLADRGMPFFADVLELADQLLRYVARHSLDPASQQRLAEVRQRLDRVFQSALPSGHFIALPGLPRPSFLGDGEGAVSVGELLGILGRKQA